MLRRLLIAVKKILGMKRSIHLFIGNMEAEFSTVPDVLYTFKTDDVTSPAAVKNSYSKTITLPGTPKNNRIFGQYWAGDRITGANYDATRKTPFTLYVDNEVYQTGYCRLMEINQNRNSVSYSVSLFGGLGEFFSNLEYSDNEAGTDEKKKISDLEFYSDSGSTVPIELDFTINKETVEEAWTNIDGYSSKWHVINFAPAYNGLPNDFDADKVLMNVGSVTPSGSTQPVRHPGGRGAVVTTSVTQDGVTYTTYGGYALAEMSRDYTPSEMREFRSYLMRPVLNVQRTIEAICRPENNGGWKVVLDPDWFKYDNPYWADLWCTLPMLSTLEYTASEVSTGTTVLLGAKASGTTSTGDPGYFEDVLASLSEPDSGMAFDVNVRVSLDINGVTAGAQDDLVICANSSASNTYYASAIMVQLVAYDIMGNPVAGSDEYYITSSYGVRRSGQGATGTMAAYFIPRNDFNYKPPYGDGFVNAKGTYFEKITGTTSYRWNEEISLTAKNVPAGSTMKVLVTKVYKAGGTQNGAKYVFYRDVQGGQQVKYSAYTFNDFTVTLNSSRVAFKTNSGIRTGAGFTKKQLLDTDYSPCDFLLSYAKIYGLYFLADPIKKQVEILTRKNFFRRDEIVDIEKYIDRSSVKITPLVFDTKWYDWNLEADESEYGKAYENTYGKKYGQAKVNVDFNFNRDTTEVLDGNIFKNAVQVLERSNAYCYTGQDTTSKPWMFPGYTYLLYDTTDSTNTHEVEVPPSSTIDAFSAFTEGYMYYDLFDKVQLHTADFSPADGKNVLLIRTGDKSLTVGTTKLNYYITDDNSYMNILNAGKPCWLFTNSETDPQGNSIAIRLDAVPYFSRYRIAEGSGYITRAMDFGRPEEIYIPKAIYRPGSTIYEAFWQTYISDLYSKNTRKMTAKMLIREKPSADWLRRFYYFDNSIWRMTAINDYNVAKDALTEVEFVKVNDIANYTSEAADGGVSITLTLSSYELPPSGGTVNYSITVSDGGDWVFETFPWDTTLSATAGTGDYTGTWTIPANLSSSEQQLRLVVMADNASAVATLTLKGVSLSISGPNEQGEVPATGGTRTYTLVSPDSEWSAGTPYSGIITAVTPSSGVATDASGITVTAYFGENTDPTTREAYVTATVPNGYTARSGWAKQAAAAGATIQVTPSYLNHVPASGGTIQLTVYSTASWRALATYPDRLTVSPSTGDSGTSIVTATIAENSTQSTKTAQLYFYRDDSPVSDPAVFTISQDAAPEQYLRFDILSGGTLGVQATQDHGTILSCSTDGGETWTEMNSDLSPSINVSAGDTVLWRGDNAEKRLVTKFVGTAYFNVSGNLMSLVYETGFTAMSSNTMDYQFDMLFAGSNVVSAQNLVLPQEHLTGTYDSMFNGCSHLTIAPVLPSATVQGSAYRYLFGNCTSLQYVKCLATSILTYAGIYGTKNWMNGASASGTFVKAAAMTGWSTGVDGIPSGWTVQDA